MSAAFAVMLIENGENNELIKAHKMWNDKLYSENRIKLYHEMFQFFRNDSRLSHSEMISFIIATVRN